MHVTVWRSSPQYSTLYCTYAVWTSSQLQCIRDGAAGMNLESVSKCQLWLVLCSEGMAAASHVTINALPFNIHYEYKLFPVSSAVYAVF